MDDDSKSRLIEPIVADVNIVMSKFLDHELANESLEEPKLRNEIGMKCDADADLNEGVEERVTKRQKKKRKEPTLSKSGACDVGPQTADNLSQSPSAGIKEGLDKESGHLDNGDDMNSPSKRKERLSCTLSEDDDELVQTLSYDSCHEELVNGSTSADRSKPKCDCYAQYSDESVFGDEPDHEREFDGTTVCCQDPDAWPERMQQLEEEQEQLNSSLIALTSHFAQVQLRLKQIVDASPEEKEERLKELEEFAFRGIPDLRHPSIDMDFENEGALILVEGETREQAADNRLELQRLKQKQLITKLKDQLEDLEKYAYETGDLPCIPSSMLLERQTVIIEQLKGKLPLDLDELDKLDKLSPEELRRQVDRAIRELVNPVIMKEQLVNQLKTQVTDLERFIGYLQHDGDPRKAIHGMHGKCTCSCPLHGNSQRSLEPYDEDVAKEQMRSNKRRTIGEDDSDDEEEGKSEAMRIIRRVLTLLQMITFAQFGCNSMSQRFEKNLLKKTSKGNHWGDLRARLELAVDHVLEINSEKFCNDSDYTSDSDESPVHCSEKMSSVVRKELSVALRDLLQHGLTGYPTTYPNNGSKSMIPSALFDWGCFSERSSQVSSGSSLRGMTAWDLFLKYYELKNGNIYKASPARRLSQSFNLHIVGGVAITPKQTLFSAIDDVIETHTPLKRSPDSHLKAFLCMALNQGKLTTWLKLVVKSRSLVDNYYEAWSYVSSTGFDDALRSLDRLTGIRFNLPTDLAVRQLKNINEAF